MISKNTRERWQHQVDYLEDTGFAECSDWELSFIDSISASLDQGKELTMKQSSKLGQIFHRINGKVG